MRRMSALVCAGMMIAGLSAGTVAGQEATPVAGEVEIVSVSTLPIIPIGETLNGKLGAGTVSDDRGIPIGGAGSDLWRSANDPEGEFWMLTDRGPNFDVEVDGEELLTFPVPEFTPMILHVRLNGEDIEVLDVVPVVGQSGKGVTGVSNSAAIDVQPYDFMGKAEIPYNPSGLDSEGMIRMPDGSFWLADEYSPSLVKVDATGKVAERLIPKGHELVGADYPVMEVLPSILSARRGNRGFEGLGLTPDGKTLLAVVQSPLGNPDEETGETSRVTRILAVDAITGEPAAEYAYVMESGPEFDPAEGIEQADMKVSGIVAIDNDTALVLERTDDVARLYTIELAGATNLLGTAWDDASTTPSLEAGDLSADVTPVAKTLLADLSTADVPTKIEGVAVVDGGTLAVSNDNDFDLGSLEEGSVAWAPGGKRSEIILLKVPGGIPAASAVDMAAATPAP